MLRVLLRVSQASLFLIYTSAARQSDTLRRAQNPSPMEENTRLHERVADVDYGGAKFTISNLLPRPIDVAFFQKVSASDSVDLLLHFHGARYVVHYASGSYLGNLIATTINLGSGSSAYGNAFEDSTVFERILKAIKDSTDRRIGRATLIKRIVLSAFSAGYGAVRKILSTQQNYAMVDAVGLLDGIHASYVPERRVLAEGGTIDSSGLQAFLALAQDASRPESRKKFMITHSEIFPGTFVSTTEATDFILQKLDINRTPVLEWGPLGMQQISLARRHHFAVLGFAGNTARDHVDHYHGLFSFLQTLLRL